MFLLFDTETSNLPQDNIELSHPCQARLLQLAFLLIDEKYKEIACYNSLIKIPEHCQIHEKAFAQHKITKEYARQYGVMHQHSFDIFMSCLRHAKVVVGFGLDFDIKIANIEYELLTGDPIDWSEKRCKCLMKLSTPIVKLPFGNGGINRYGQKYKWPKLVEAYAFFQREIMVDAHDAFSDVRATAKIMKTMVEDYGIVL